MLHTPAEAEWWSTAKLTFNRSFSSQVDSWLAANEPAGAPPSAGAIDAA